MSLGLHNNSYANADSPHIDTGPLSIPSGSLVLCGRQGNRHPGSNNFFNDEQSVFSEVKIPSGEVIQTLLPIHGGHEVLPIGQYGQFLCLSQYGKKSCVIDTKHHIVAVIEAPLGELFSGHGLFSAKENKVILTTFKSLLIYDVKTWKKLDSISVSFGGSHEIHYLPDSGDCVLSGFTGKTTDKNLPYYEKKGRASIIVLDGSSLKQKRVIEQPHLAAMYHLDVDRDGLVYAVLQQNLDFGPGEQNPDYADHVTRLMRETYPKRDWPISRLEFEEKLVNVALPMLRIDPATSEIKEYFTSAKTQRRSQSVAVHPKSGKVFATYVWSNTLLVYDPHSQLHTTVSGAELGVDEIAGVCDIPSTNCIAVNGMYRGISIVDTSSMKVMAHYPVDHYRSSHIICSSLD